MLKGSPEECMVIIIGAFMLSIVVLFGVFIWLNHRHRKQLERIMTYQINVAATIDRNIPELLDLIIQDSFQDYEVKYLAPLNEQYINEEREKEIRDEIVKVVINRISSASLDKLSLFYSINGIADILADKIYIIVMNYVANHNAPFLSNE